MAKARGSRQILGSAAPQQALAVNNREHKVDADHRLKFGHRQRRGQGHRRKCQLREDCSGLHGQHDLLAAVAVAEPSAGNRHPGLHDVYLSRDMLLLSV